MVPPSVPSIVARSVPSHPSRMSGQERRLPPVLSKANHGAKARNAEKSTAASGDGAAFAATATPVAADVTRLCQGA